MTYPFTPFLSNAHFHTNHTCAHTHNHTHASTHTHTLAQAYSTAQHSIINTESYPPRSFSRRHAHPSPANNPHAPPCSTCHPHACPPHPHGAFRLHSPWLRLCDTPPPHLGTPGYLWCVFVGAVWHCSYMFVCLCL